MNNRRNAFQGPRWWFVLPTTLLPSEVYKARGAWIFCSQSFEKSKRVVLRVRYSSKGKKRRIEDKMYRGLTICLTIYCCGAAVIPIKDQVGNEQTEQNEETNQRTFATLGVGAQQPIYPVAQSNQPAVNRYFYPTYPEYGNTGYAFQTGYGGYPVPTVLSQQNTDSAWITETGTSLLPFSDDILLYGVRAGVYLLHFLFAIIVGGAFTIMVCTFTPICTISFIGFGFTNNHHVKEHVAELSQNYLTDEIVNAATILVSKALDNYAAMQRERHENTKQRGTEKLDDSSSIR